VHFAENKESEKMNKKALVVSVVAIITVVSVLVVLVPMFSSARADSVLPANNAVPVNTLADQISMYYNYETITNQTRIDSFMSTQAQTFTSVSSSTFMTYVKICLDDDPNCVVFKIQNTFYLDGYYHGPNYVITETLKCTPYPS
jgi:hypothetical protein